MSELDTPEIYSTELPSPHFDDEATLVSARPVVPIAAAKRYERKRILRRALPFIAAAGLAGIALGLAVGYYAKRRVNRELPTARVEAPVRGETAATTEIAAGKSETAEGTSQNTQAQAAEIATSSPELANKKAAARHVFPRFHNRNVILNSVRNTKRGASHIQEIFAGPNP